MRNRCRQLIKIVTIGNRSSAAQAGVRELHEGARAMRQALTLGREPVLFVSVHLAERAVEAVGPKQRIIAEALIAARRPRRDAIDAPFEFLHMAVRPCE